MRFAGSLACALAGLAFVAADADVFEPADFSITDALLEQGINVTEIPALADFNATSAVGKRTSGSKCSVACASLKFIYSTNVVYMPCDSRYTNYTESYWSDAQQEVNPSCVFKPSQAADVSVAVLLARLTQCPFAARSGGHAAMEGASNIEGGVTISFENLNNISLSDDKTVASIGPGNIWGEVFETLSALDLTVIGGRLYNIGVGGLTTGGGISYFSAEYGWACDNVESYDVVTASGVLVHVSATQYPDLFWALRGGGNNFGLVVNFNLNTIPLPGGLVWGGQKMYLEDSFSGLDEAFHYATINSAQDVKGGQYLVYVYVGGANLGLPVLYHADPVNGGNSSLWAGYNNLTALSDTTMTRDLVEWASETMNDSPKGLRQLFYTMTTTADVGIASFARQYFFDTVSQIADVPGIVPNIVFQGIGIPQLNQMQKNGGNALGLSADGGAKYIILLASSWYNKEDDERVTAYLSDVLKVIKAESEARGVSVDYVYMNYASKYQDAVSSYGAANKADLKSIAAKYDPAQVFQILEPGYFKLDHAPVPGTDYFNI